ncbi:MAG: DUF3105 domain-containing protein [Thermoleophilia bacterium]
MKGRWPAITLYVVVWLATGFAAAAILLLVLRDGDDGKASLPPVQQTALRVAAQRAGCELRAGGGQRRDEPPVAGGPAAPAAPGFYGSAPPRSAIVGALRRGIVVISYRPDITREQRALLRALQDAVPRGTIVAPNEAMPFAIAVTAWRRLLGCRRAGPETIDALRLFRGRFVGEGPDSPS